MSGLEIVGAIAAVISAYGTCDQLFSKYKEKIVQKIRKRIWLKSSRDSLQLSLVTSPQHIQSEYNSGFARFGLPFSQGDDLARTQMSGLVIEMQQSLIEKLIFTLNNGQGSLDGLFNISEDSRVMATSILDDQSQRLMIQAPIPPTVHSPPRSVASPRISDQSHHQSFQAPIVRNVRPSPTASSDANYKMFIAVKEQKASKGGNLYMQKDEIIAVPRSIAQSKRTTWRGRTSDREGKFSRKIVRDAEDFKFVSEPKVVAEWPFDGQMPGDLNFKKGEKIVVLNSDRTRHWWSGRIDDRYGVFPSNYVKFI